MTALCGVPNPVKLGRSAGTTIAALRSRFVEYSVRGLAVTCILCTNGTPGGNAMVVHQLNRTRECVSLGCGCARQREVSIRAAGSCKVQMPRLARRAQCSKSF
ncbi:hypothetical protein LIA77_09758 [Sarocladium implicatum]|nr:hypothetical protein LIA77_09758 [Sarocladium implicatum]